MRGGTGRKKKKQFGVGRLKKRLCQNSSLCEYFKYGELLCIHQATNRGKSQVRRSVERHRDKIKLLKQRAPTQLHAKGTTTAL